MIRKQSAGDWLLDVVAYASMTLMGIVTLLPFMNVLSKAFSAEWAVVTGKVSFLPIDFQLDTMKFVVTGQPFLNAFAISIYITLAGTVISLAVTAITAYPLSKKEIKGMKWMMIVFVFTMLFSGGLIPSYMLIKHLNLINNVWAVILPGVVNVFNLLIVKSYYETLPESLEESARIDGASNLGIVFRIIIPLSLPVLATICLFIAVGYWNEYFNPMLYLTQADLKPLQVYMRDLVMDAQGSSDMLYRNSDDLLNVTPEGVRSATIIASTVPIVLIYPFLQKYFIKGVLIGSVKG
ncbi:carbohydrate ABC transporter permease [Cohnella cellulosilytica]|uniref:Carbohydrate ABC transporter permease n=1 Tax=Cohnella cellulosilytica TaxID=986710 RepID=A0ABW2FK82_9BACL